MFVLLRKNKEFIPREEVKDSTVVVLIANSSFSKGIATFITLLLTNVKRHSNESQLISNDIQLMRGYVV